MYGTEAMHEFRLLFVWSGSLEASNTSAFCALVFDSSTWAAIVRFSCILFISWVKQRAQSQVVKDLAVKHQRTKLRSIWNSSKFHDDRNERESSNTIQQKMLHNYAVLNIKTASISCEAAEWFFIFKSHYTTEWPAVPYSWVTARTKFNFHSRSGQKLLHIK